MGAVVSADLPETHRSSAAMARVLTQYLDCPFTVQQRIREDFDQAPSIDTIRRMRAQHLAGPKRQRCSEPFKPHDGYHPSDASDQAAANNAVFLRQLRRAYPQRFVG